MIDFGYFIKYSDTEYDVLVDKNTKNSGYNVVSRDVFKRCKYSLDEVKTYAEAHPEMELSQWPEDTISEEEQAAQVRAERNYRIDSAIKRVQRFDTQTRLGITTKETDITSVLQYIQDLRDITKQEGFPGTVVWPNEPEET